MDLTPKEEAAYNRAKQQHYLVREAAQQNVLLEKTMLLSGMTFFTCIML